MRANACGDGDERAPRRDGLRADRRCMRRTGDLCARRRRLRPLWRACCGAVRSAPDPVCFETERRTMQEIELDRLYAHPDNANVMDDDALDALAGHIERSGWYPPLIVRPHPSVDGAFEMIDGHHRALALRRLGWSAARCDVWPADDASTDELLLTLNRLRGEDDPTRRAHLLSRMRERFDVSELASRLPEDVRRIERLIATLDPPPEPAPPPEPDAMPQPVTFFLTAAQRRAVLSALRSVDDDRTTALLRVTGVER